jgi:2-succinyl-6-hydroxy-2,4-cyclohexadiene-1-carboxylate synthase
MQKKSLALLHGFTGSSQSWAKFHLADVSLMMPNIAGHGDFIPNDLADYAIEREAARIAATITEAVHLLGYSMGGRLALTIAVHYPDKVKSLILESATAGLKTESERQERIQSDNALADKIEANGMEWFAEYWGNLPLWANQTAEQKAAL